MLVLRDPRLHSEHLALFTYHVSRFTFHVTPSTNAASPPTASTRCRKRAAGPPSTRRWSKVRLSQTISRGSTWSPAQTGCVLMRPTPRIAHSGRLMIGVNASMPYIPRLVSVKVLPANSSGVHLPPRARSARRGGFGGQLRQPLAIHPAHHRRQQPAFGVHRHGDVDLRPELDSALRSFAPSPSSDALSLGCSASALARTVRKRSLYETATSSAASCRRNVDQRGRVRLGGQRHRRGLAVAGDHALGDEGADAGEWELDSWKLEAGSWATGWVLLAARSSAPLLPARSPFPHLRVVIYPRGPVPVIACQSSPASSAIRRAMGVTIEAEAEVESGSASTLTLSLSQVRSHIPLNDRALRPGGLDCVQ